jgi:hypothetical protein
MTITARYASRCATCSRPIAVGEQIEWTKGQPARHPGCAARPATTASERTVTRPAGRCDECGATGYPLRPCRDSSGIPGRCCPHCASTPACERSFA